MLGLNRGTVGFLALRCEGHLAVFYACGNEQRRRRRDCEDDKEWGEQLSAARPILLAVSHYAVSFFLTVAAGFPTAVLAVPSRSVVGKTSPRFPPVPSRWIALPYLLDVLAQILDRPAQGIPQQHCAAGSKSRLPCDLLPRRHRLLRDQLCLDLRQRRLVIAVVVEQRRIALLLHRIEHVLRLLHQIAQLALHLLGGRQNDAIGIVGRRTSLCLAQAGETDRRHLSPRPAPPPPWSFHRPASGAVTSGRRGRCAAARTHPDRRAAPVDLPAPASAPASTASPC